mmetsp:Transcript_20893/g.18521  ORF Transcript_20893/g.18521 Transcript_20893/m.18521 type:complete len:189 (+) Transcript_20893:280-846(+)
MTSKPNIRGKVDFADYLYQKKMIKRKDNKNNGLKVKTTRKLKNYHLEGTSNLEGQINTEGRSKFIKSNHNALLGLLKQVSEGKPDNEFSPKFHKATQKMVSDPFTQKYIQNYAEQSEEFLIKNPQLFSEIGVITTKEIQENLDAMKDALGFTLKLGKDDMNYNYSDQYNNFKDVIKEVQGKDNDSYFD